MERVKIQSARVRDKIVEIEYNGSFLPTDDVIIVSAGQGDSDGVVMIGETQTRYFTNTQLDLAFLIERQIELCSQLEIVGNKQTWVIGVAGGSGAPAVPVIGPFPDLVQVATDTAAIRTELENLELK